MRSPSLVGRTLGGRYALRERLGEGGWGVVYAATQLDLGRPVAVKVLHTNVALASDGLARFEREAKASAALGHPNIAQVTDFQVNPGEPPFLVMELLTGQTLGAALGPGGRLDPSRVAWIAHQVLAALDVAHRAGMVHRDVKPDNIFLVSMPGVEDHAKLLDFGIAKLSGDTHGAQQQLTNDGTMLGSPAYMAPEQIRGWGIDHRVDLYAVGATMYRALAGRIPFDAPNVHGLLLAITEQRPVPLVQIDPSIDPALSAFVDRALHKDPEGRFKSASEMRDALAPFVASSVRSGPIRSGPGFARGTGPTAAVAPPTTPIGHSSPTPFVGPPAMTSPLPNQVTPGAYGLAPAGSPVTPAARGVSAGPPYAMAAPSASPPPVAEKRSAAGAIIALFVAIVVLLLVLVGGVAGFLVHARSKDAAAAAAPTPASATTSAASAAASATANASANVATSAATAQAASAVPGAGAVTPPRGKTTTDAGAPAIVVVDAGGGGSTARKQYAGGANVYLAGGSFEKYPLGPSREAIERHMPQIKACYVATEYDPPDHQFNYYTVTIDPAGNVTSVAPVTDASNHPKLNPCLFAVLRQVKFAAIPGGGSIRISFTARTRDNP